MHRKSATPKGRVLGKWVSPKTCFCFRIRSWAEKQQRMSERSANIDTTETTDNNGICVWGLVSFSVGTLEFMVRLFIWRPKSLYETKSQREQY